MPASTHPKSKLAGDLFDLVAAKLGAVAASRFMFSGNDQLNGRSPIEALKAGDNEQVKQVVMMIGADT